MIFHPFAIIVLGLFVIAVITKLACSNIRLRGKNAILQMQLDVQAKQIEVIMKGSDDVKTRMDNLTDLIQRVDRMSDEIKNED